MFFIVGKTTSTYWYSFLGYLCQRRHLDKTNGCCQTISSSMLGPYICDNCTLSTYCCNSFEHCISCCLKPEHVWRDVFYFAKLILNIFSEFIFNITFVHVIWRPNYFCHIYQHRLMYVYHVVEHIVTVLFMKTSMSTWHINTVLRHAQINSNKNYDWFGLYQRGRKENRKNSKIFSISSPVARLMLSTNMSTG